MEIFDEFIVVDEKTISVTVQDCGNCICTFRDVTQFAALEFVTSSGPILKIKDIGNASSKRNVPVIPLAQIVSWKWNQNGAQQIIKTYTLNKGSEINYIISADANDSPSFVIRILKKQEKNAFPAPSSSSMDLTVKIGDKKVKQQHQ